MRKLTKPVEHAGDVLITCISNFTDTNLKARLTSIKNLITAATNEFEAAAVASELHKIKPTNGIGGVVTTDEMVKIYDQKLAKRGQPGRVIYEKLKSAPKNDRCPLCGQRTVSSLDHHLPKKVYPALAVTPTNLIPACNDCNKTKLKSVPTKAEEETLHPYYDDVENELWLRAAVIETSPAAFIFFVSPPTLWGKLIKCRIEHHFNLFKLANLYTSHAAEELTNIRQNLVDLYSKAGTAGVRMHLQGQASSRRAAHINSWQTSMYQAMADTDWFCNGGFK